MKNVADSLAPVDSNVPSKITSSLIFAFQTDRFDILESYPPAANHA